MYLKKTVYTKNRIFVEKVKCYYFDPAAAGKARRPKRFATGETKAERNRKRAYQNRKYLLYNNFETGDMWVTLTYSQENTPATPEDAHRNILYILSLIQKKLKRDGIPFVWFLKTEAGEQMRVHHHLLIRNNFDMIDMIYGYWKKFGKVRDFQEIYNLNNGKLITYFLDGGEHKRLDFEKFTHSRNLKKPKIKTVIMPVKSFRQMPRIPKGENGEEYEIQNLYNGYTDRDGYVYQSYELVLKEERKE